MIYSLVTSLAEVWIETDMSRLPCAFYAVTSLAEVWIETSELDYFEQLAIVPSLAEVWIETRRWATRLMLELRHFPCGSVD